MGRGLSLAGLPVGEGINSHRVPSGGGDQFPQGSQWGRRSSRTGFPVGNSWVNLTKDWGERDNPAMD